MQHRLSRTALFSLSSKPLLALDAVLSSSLFILPNILMGGSIAVENGLPQSSGLMRLSEFVEAMGTRGLVFWLALNLVLIITVMYLRRHVFLPIGGLLKQLRAMSASMTGEAHPRALSLRCLAGEMTRLAETAQEYYHKHRAANEALIQARSLVEQITAQQNAILHCASREMISQYQAVLTYAHYLEEQIARQAAQPDLRFDFDEVSESSFNLKLIAGSLNLIEYRQAPVYVNTHVPQLMEQTMLALAPSLDRRCMRLTSAEVDLAVHAFSDPAIIAHVLWMMLLGTIRYAADESTLRLRCLYNRERTRAMISIVISELSPGQLTAEERGAFLTRKMQHLTPHMFAETIRIQANIQLAQMLMDPLDGQLSILPITTNSCEICLNLPAAPPA